MATVARMNATSRLRPEARVRIPQHVVHRHFPAQTVVLNLETGRYHGLNPTAGRMLDALEQEQTRRRGGARIVADHYRSRARTSSATCASCARSLLERGLVELADAARAGDGALRVILELAAVTRTFAGATRAGAGRSRARARRAAGPHRAQRLGQVDAAAVHRRHGCAEQRHDHVSRAHRRERAPPASASEPRSLRSARSTCG